ncbi:MAG: response regulator [Euryarchaeota archaeon]|nr:response regulator [Euryarchaeota archaeon]
MKKTILLVDDNPDITLTIKGLLEGEREDFKVVIAESGEECLELLNKDILPDAILLDIMLPGIDGLETSECIRKNDKFSKIPILFITARNDQFIMEQGRFLGDDFIEKPFEIDDVIIRIERAIEKLAS